MTVSSTVVVPSLQRIALARAEENGQDWRNRHFVDLNAKGATFSNCDFSYSVFERAYFRGARFKNCTFTGCKFYDSSFRGADLIQTSIHFARFYRCELDEAELVAALPLEPNLRRDILQNLRVNASEMGDYRAQRYLVMQEIEASKDHYWRAVRAKEDYYRRKYGAIAARAGALLKLAGLNFSGFLWGNGERPANIIFSGAVFVLILSLINFWSVMPRVGWVDAAAGLNVLKYCVEQFLGLAVDVRYRGFYVVDLVLILMRYIYIGLYISVLHRSIAHR